MPERRGHSSLVTPSAGKNILVTPSYPLVTCEDYTRFVFRGQTRHKQHFRIPVVLRCPLPLVHAIAIGVRLKQPSSADIPLLSSDSDICTAVAVMKGVPSTTAVRKKYFQKHHGA